MTIKRYRKSFKCLGVWEKYGDEYQKCVDTVAQDLTKEECQKEAVAYGSKFFQHYFSTVRNFCTYEIQSCDKVIDAVNEPYHIYRFWEDIEIGNFLDLSCFIRECKHLIV